MNWREIIDIRRERLTRPRRYGLTMVIDKGLGLNETADLLMTAGNYIDIIKFAFGTTALYPPNILKEKIELITTYGIDVCPGGTFLEYALCQGREEDFLNLCHKAGFTAVEISCGTIDMRREVRDCLISRAAAMGFKVITEVGKKFFPSALNIKTLRQEITGDLKKGAQLVILEGRECGNGEFLQPEIVSALSESFDLSYIMWEAPTREQQAYLIHHCGPNVNLGNIPPTEVMSLEALRMGLRADTMLFQVVPAVV